MKLAILLLRYVPTQRISNTICVFEIVINFLFFSLKEYAKQIKRNSSALAKALVEKGYTLVTGGTDNHLMLWDLRPQGVCSFNLLLCVSSLFVLLFPLLMRCPFENCS